MEEFDDDFKTTILSILTKAGLLECTIKKDENSSNGLNFTSSIIELSVTHGSFIENIVVKRGFTNKALCEAFGGRICFETEEHMYSKVIPALHRFQKAKGTDLYPHIARCFGASLESKPETFVLENLKNLGFVVHPPKSLFDGKHIELVFKELAGYHAANFAIREHDPDAWNVLNNDLLRKINYFNRTEAIKDLAVSRLRKLEMAFMRCNKPDMARHMNEFIKSINIHIEKNVEIDNYSIINHGDVWGCNIMLKYGNEQNPKFPTDIRLLDWQASRLGHLCIDLTYLTYMSALPEVLRNISHYMKLYHDHFSLCLRRLGKDSKTIFPYSVFEEQWRTCSAFAFIKAVGVFCGVYIEPDEFPDLVAAVESGDTIFNAVNFNFRNTNEYTERLMYTFEHLVQNNFIIKYNAECARPNNN